MLRTEYEFTLPMGYVDERGNLHRDGTMRLATAYDEVQPLEDPRVIANQAYLGILILSRVVTRIGTINDVSPAIIEGLFSSDYAYLQQLYLRINDDGMDIVETQCPDCGSRFALNLAEMSNG